jgi:hypothetical protein
VRVRARRGTWALSVALAVAHCRNYEREPDALAVSSGGSAGSGATAGGMPTIEAGEGGESSVAQAGAGGAAAPSESSEGREPELGPSPGSQFGAVRLLLDKEPLCGGTLVTNSWILTADQCAPSGTAPERIEIGFGADSTKFEQLRSVVEVARFTGNDGTPGTRGRDLLLLGVDEPFMIDGSDSRHHLAVDALLPRSALRTLRCVGWDLSPDPSSDTSLVHSALLTGVALQYNVEIDARAAGHRLWWSNDAADPNEGILPMPADIGSGCFFSLGQASFLATVHSGNPTRLREGGENDGREAFAQVLADPEVHGWLDRTLFGVEEHALDAVGDPGVCSLSPGTFELFSTDGDGNLSHFHFGDGFEFRSSLAPPAGAAFSSYRPGVFCTQSGGIELFAVASDGVAWQRSWTPASEEWSPSWERLRDATTQITSGLAVVGAVDHHFHVFGAGASGELRHAEFDRGWTGNWQDLGGKLDGSPVARSVQENRVDVFARSEGNRAYQMWMENGVWQRWGDAGGPITGDPVILSWSPDRVDLLVRSESGALRRRVYDTVWGEWADSQIAVPAGAFSGVARELGHMDLVALGAGSAWHATWPRLPVAVR